MYLQEDHDLASSSSSQRHVTYSCGSCGYALNLSSSNRNTSNIDSKYGNSLKKGIISFLSIDESRFTQIDEFGCLPYFISKSTWGLFRPRIKLLCRKCGNHIGYAYEEKTSTSPVSNNSDSKSNNAISVCSKYKVQMRSVQPSSDESGIRLVI
ncbi:uncharacterized protein At4g08330, chloroplastic-like [Tasmannia lanceolata]|uniref:uncharacterized protein At4g08330, chloroplastic-like n=1 Tax=Tasmannia lanceolata TaxID=3420 RepID=UPI0040631B02